MRATAPIDRLIRERHLLKHPFYTLWTRGDLPLSTLGEYAQQYYRFESNFPRYLGATYARLPDPDGRRLLLENMNDEEGRDPTHPDLWVDFGRAVGAPARPARFAPPTGPTQGLLRAYERMTLRGTAAEGLGALYAYESQFAEVAAEKSRGLRTHYGITDRAAHEFFRVHTTADVAHSGAERELLSRQLRQSPRARADAMRGARTSLGAWWGFLDQFVE